MAYHGGKIEVEVLQDCAWSGGPFAGAHPKGAIIKVAYLFAEGDIIKTFLKDNPKLLKLVKSDAPDTKGAKKK